MHTAGKSKETFQVLAMLLSGMAIDHLRLQRHPQITKE
jgi:hypothetical protein